MSSLRYQQLKFKSPKSKDTDDNISQLSNKVILSVKKREF